MFVTNLFLHGGDRHLEKEESETDHRESGVENGNKNEEIFQVSISAVCIVNIIINVSEKALKENHARFYCSPFTARIRGENDMRDQLNIFPPPFETCII